MLSVPLLVAAGVPMLPALAVAQVQSVAGSGLGAIGYAVQGGIDWPMAIFVAVPQMVGVVVGWKVARAVPARSLAFVLAFVRSEEHTSELQSLMRISYAVFCLKKKTKQSTSYHIYHIHYFTQH